MALIIPNLFSKQTANRRTSQLWDTFVFTPSIFLPLVMDVKFIGTQNL